MCRFDWIGFAHQGEVLNPWPKQVWQCSKGQRETLYQINGDSVIYSLGYNEYQWYFKCCGGFIGDLTHSFFFFTLSFIGIAIVLLLYCQSLSYRVKNIKM